MFTGNGELQTVVACVAGAFASGVVGLAAVAALGTALGAGLHFGWTLIGTITGTGC